MSDLIVFSYNRMWLYGISVHQSINVSSYFEGKDIVQLNNNYNSLFGRDPYPNKIKTLFLSIPELRHPIKIRENTPIIIKPSLLRVTRSIGIIYFVNTKLNTTDITQFLVKSQLSELYQLKIDSNMLEIDYYIIATVARNTQKFWNEWMHTELSFLPSKTITCITEDVHEYPGIHKLWTLGNSASHDYYLYFHSKGITRMRSLRRDKTEKCCFDVVIRNVNLALFVFEMFPSIHKIGATCSPNGYIWHNVFWVSQKYLVKVVEPIKTSRRHYYEDWLGRTCACASQHHPDRRELPFTHFACSYYDCFNILTSSHDYHIGAPHGPRTALKGACNSYTQQKDN